MNKHEELENALSLFHYKLDTKRELYGRNTVRNVILKISEAENVYKVLNQYESDDNKHRQDIHELDLQTVKLLKQLEATKKELEEVKAMIKEIGDSGVSFDTSHQRVVFEALMNKENRK